MLIRVSEIPDEGIRVESVTDFAGVFREEGWRLEGVSLLVERRGDEVAVTGRFEATARQACGRCLEPLVSTVRADVAAHLIPPSNVRHEQTELGPDDLEVDFYQGDILDLGRVVRSETDLVLPMKTLCRPDCRGLCPVCGANRNVTSCECQTRRVDPRLAPLEALRRRQWQS